MNIKEQNEILKNLKKEHIETLNALDDILFEAADALGYEKEDDIAIDFISDYLHGIIPLKDLRKQIKDSKNHFEENLKFG